MLILQVTVDNRQGDPNSDTWQQELVRFGLTADIATLPLGDFVWEVEEDDGQVHRFICEHKHAADLVASAEDGRLGSFVRTETDGYKVLFVTWSGGNVRRGKAREWKAEQVESLLVDAQAHGILVVRAPSKAIQIQRLAAFIRWTAKDEHRAMDRPTLPMVESWYFDDGQRDRVRLLMCIPGWGERKSLDALTWADGALISVLEAITDGTITGVPGIGKGLARQAKEFLHDAIYTC